MQSSLPARSSLLYASAIIAFFLALEEFCTFVYNTQFVHSISHPITVIVMFLFTTPFMSSSIFLFYFIRNHYPSKRIGMTARIFFFISIALATGIGIFYWYFILDIFRLSAFWLRERLTQVDFLLSFIPANLLILFQLFNSIEGIRLVKIINRNHRTELSDSFR